LSQLQPGSHTVRISLAGYNDYEQSVELAAGETVNLRAALNKVQPPPPETPSGPGPDSRNPLDTGGGGGVNPLDTGGGGGTGPPSDASGQPGSLGVMVSNQAAPSGRGAYVSSVAPGSPADRAGLKPGHTIMSVNGQTIAGPQQLLDIITRSHAGDYIQIAYNDGSQLRWTRAQLAPRAASSTPPQSLPPAAGGLLGGITTPGATPAQTMPVMTYTVMHDHGQTGQSYCTGALAVGGGRIAFRSNNSNHQFEYGLSEVKEAKKNGVYLAALGAFHIRIKSGPNYNFIVLGPTGQHQSPEELLRAVNMAMGGN
jgi:membrane-associated protease RseP (regulator of RpoE activity)